MPLESVSGSNAKIELCGQDVFMLHSDVGKVPDTPMAARARGEDGAVVDELVNGSGLVNGGLWADTRKGSMDCWDG